jgi:hypothetical protein
MTTPNYDDLKHDGRPRNDSDWNNVLTRIQNNMTDGNSDFNLKSITATTYNNLPGFDISDLILGENITEGQGVRLKSSDGRVYKTDSNSLEGVTNVLGILKKNGSTGETAVISQDSYTLYTSLTAGTNYFLGVSGALSSSIGTYYYKIGIALNSTTLLITTSNQDWKLPAFDVNLITEWNSLANYSINSFTKESGIIYKSLTNNNINHQPSLDGGINWKIYILDANGNAIISNVVSSAQDYTPAINFSETSGNYAIYTNILTGYIYLNKPNNTNLKVMLSGGTGGSGTFDVKLIMSEMGNYSGGFGNAKESELTGNAISNPVRVILTFDLSSMGLISNDTFSYQIQVKRSSSASWSGIFMVFITPKV